MMNCIFQKARKDFEYFHHQELVKVDWECYLIWGATAWYSQGPGFDPQHCRKPNVLEHYYNPSNGEVEAGISEVQVIYSYLVSSRLV